MNSDSNGEPSPDQSRKLTHSVSTIGMSRNSTRPSTAGATNSQPVTRSQRCSESLARLAAGRRGGRRASECRRPGREDLGGCRHSTLSPASVTAFDQPVDVGVTGDELLELRVELGDDVGETGPELPAMGVLGAVEERLELGVIGEPAVAQRLRGPASR